MNWFLVALLVWLLGCTWVDAWLFTQSFDWPRWVIVGTIVSAVIIELSVGIWLTNLAIED